jgi:hypothetical protein
VCIYTPPCKIRMGYMWGVLQGGDEGSGSYLGDRRLAGTNCAPPPCKMRRMYTVRISHRMRHICPVCILQRGVSIYISHTLPETQWISLLLSRDSGCLHKYADS